MSYRLNSAEMITRLAAEVRRLRHARGLTQDEVAALAGVGRETVLNMEAGRTDPEFSTVAKVANVLGLSLDNIVTLTAPPQPAPAPPSKLSKRVEQLTKAAQRLQDEKPLVLLIRMAQHLGPSRPAPRSDPGSKAGRQTKAPRKK